MCVTHRILWFTGHDHLEIESSGDHVFINKGLGTGAEWLAGLDESPHPCSLSYTVNY